MCTCECEGEGVGVYVCMCVSVGVYNRTLCMRMYIHHSTVTYDHRTGHSISSKPFVTNTHIVNTCCIRVTISIT